MYRFSDNNANNDIGLHDCRATEFWYDDSTLTFVFDEGFCVLADNRYNDLKKNAYTGRAELEFKASYKDIETNMTVYIFTDTEDKNKSIRERISLEQFRDMINSGAELEFLYSYKGYMTYLFECWLWCDTTPHTKECMIIISADEVTYKWNELLPE
ncbi:hypothetical protein [Ruminococcus sp.]|uniref:hypothetical protein n=1 Tax=Ruminococcus sp. TaxID=41978 RepID=UPI0025F49ADE|nr:hypothetical protein [Ruminococcus sp.]MBQ8965314.1 hypothetical protein [Ruminococcus sp.]